MLKLHMCREIDNSNRSHFKEPRLEDVLTQVRQNTVECLREIADYMDEIGRKAGVAKVQFL